MADSGKELVIRGPRKKARHGGHHGGAWKVAYADFVTAMMALFIVLWIVGQNQKVKEAVSGYFQDPAAYLLGVEKGGPVGETQPGGGPAGDSQANDEARLRQMSDVILEALKDQPQLARLAEQVHMEIVKEGLRIELQERSESFFFDVGTANLQREAVDLLRVIAVEVGKLPNHLIVEGHTDSRRYSRADGYTNFELSADRANTARRILVDGGVRTDQVDEIRGYADTRLRDRTDPLNLINRRISIIIKFVQKS
jgi:chemotaxis protein MotB